MTTVAREQRVGKVYKSRKSFPRLARGEFKKKDDFTYDLKVGETFKVTDYDAQTGFFTLINLDLDEVNAWFEVTEDDLQYLLREGDYK